MPTKFKTKPDQLAVLMQSLGDFLTPESARHVLKFKVDRRVQARVERLGEKCSDGRLTEQERAEYTGYVRFGTLMDTLKSRARLLLKNHGLDS